MSHWIKLHTPVLSGQDAQQCILSSLRNFYYSQDMVTADFDAHVRCMPVDERAEHVDIALHEMSPIREALVLFYTFKNKEKQVYLWGGLRYDELEERVSMVKIRANKSCAFVMRSVVEQQREAGRDLEFSIPTALRAVGMEVGTRSATSALRADVVEEVVTCSVPSARSADGTDEWIEQRIAWYKTIEQNDGRYSPPPPPSTPPAQSAGGVEPMLRISYTLLHLIPRDPSAGVYDGRTMCNRFRAMMVRAESMHLYHKLQGMHEDDLYQFLLLQNHMDYCNVVKNPSAQDHRQFVALYPNAPILLCKRWIRVRMEEVFAVAENMALEPGGMVHLPVYWEAVYKWLIVRFEQSVQRHFTEHAAAHATEQRLRPQHAEYVRLARDVAKFILTDKPVTVTVSFNEKHGGDRTPVDASQGVFVEDIEDMWKAMPPCMSQLKNRGRFPRNGERLYFIPAMWNGGFNITSIERLLNAMNDRWPKSPPEPIEVRANQHDLIRRNKGVHWCANVIKHTLQKRDDALQCPFVDEVNKTTDTCGAKCAAAMQLKYPVRAPHKVIQVKLKKRSASAPAQGAETQSVSAAPPAPRAGGAGGAALSSSSSSSDDDDEKYERKWKKHHIEI